MHLNIYQGSIKRTVTYYTWAQWLCQNVKNGKSCRFLIYFVFSNVPQYVFFPTGITCNL